MKYFQDTGQNAQELIALPAVQPSDVDNEYDYVYDVPEEPQREDTGKGGEDTEPVVVESYYVGEAGHESDRRASIGPVETYYVQ